MSQALEAKCVIDCRSQVKPSRKLRFAVGVAFVFAVALVPWESVRGAAFPDLDNYEARIVALGASGAPVAGPEGIVAALTGEFAWLLIIWALSSSGLEPRLGLLVCSALAAAVFFAFASRRTGPVLTFVLLMNPVVIDLLVSQVRSAFAFAIVLVAIVADRKWVRYPLLAIASLVHTGMLLPVSIILAYDMILALGSTSPAAIMWFALSLLAAMLSAGVLPSVLEAVGDRRAGIAVPTKSAEYLAFWPLLAWAVASVEAQARRVSIETILMVSMVAGAVAMEASGLPAFRYVALAFPLLVVSVSQQAQPWRGRLGLALAGYQCVLLVYWV